MTIATTSDTIPDTTPGSATRPSLAVYDGTTMVGHLIRHGNNFEAVDSNGTSHGTFDSMKDAAFAIPAKEVL
jgi:hypothetical protein